MSNDDNFGFYLGIFGVLLFIGAMVWYVSFAIKASSAIDKYAARKHQQWLVDKAKCEERGGIATQSAWDGRLTDCKFPPSATTVPQ